MSDEFDTPIESVKKEKPSRSRYAKSRNKSSLQSDEKGIIIETHESGMTKKVKIDLELDTTVKDLGPNPYAKFLHFSMLIDSFRLFPRIFIVTYLIILYSACLGFGLRIIPTDFPASA